MTLNKLRMLVVLLWAALYGQEKPVVSEKKPPLPELFVRAQAQPPEIAAYALRQLARTGKIPGARLPELRREISEQLLSGAAPWYPRYPASGDVPNGYAGLSVVSQFGLDRLSLFIENSPIAPSDSAAKWLEFLSTTLSRRRAAVDCSFPVVEIGRPAFQRVGVMVKENVSKDKEKVETVVSAAQGYVASPLEISGYLEMLELLPEPLLESEIGRIGQVFRKAEPLPTGAIVLLRNADFFAPLQRLAARNPGKFAGLQDDIRGFVVREVGQSLCEVDAGPESAEVRVRLALVRRYNEFVKVLYGTKVGISDEEVEKVKQSRKIIKASPLDLTYPPAVQQGFQGLATVNRSAEATADQKRAASGAFLDAWRQWAARPDGPNIGATFDSKAGLLATTLRAAATNRPETVAAFVQYVSNHELRKTDPVLWAAMILGFIETAKGGRAFGGADPVDTAMIEQIRRTAKDPALLVLLEASLLDLPEGK